MKQLNNDYIYICIFSEKDENFDLNAFKIILFALSNAKLPEKYRCIIHSFKFLQDKFPKRFHVDSDKFRLLSTNNITKCYRFTSQINGITRNLIESQYKIYT